jgi:hypothetical protein
MTYDIQLKDCQYFIGIMRSKFRHQTYLAYISIVLIHLLDISVDDFEGNKFVIRRVASGNEEEGGVTSVDNLRICA